MNNFIDKLNYLGATLGLSKPMPDYVDLEVFFLEATLYLGEDSRLKNAILNWLAKYSILLSPSKIRRLLPRVTHQEVFLENIVTFLMEHNYVKHNWEILKKKSVKSNIHFQENFKKYLKSNQFILQNVPEIRYRAEGRNQVVADLLAFIQKQTYQSLYEIAKRIHSPRNRVNESFRQLQSFGLI